ncbi:CIC11C00000004620 [Sungouiella intermedia]|uniref:CIC11C00000004620 n=1 Tax=Sungouiella intermedia TaxID=45354 RepID=A0A1L0FSS3_9ASCO|nr:CIC11C00000004620 [[Candida] intermedia]
MPAVEPTSSNPENGGLTKDASNGFLLSILSAAHNAAHMIESMSKDEKNSGFSDQLAENTGSNINVNTSIAGGTDISNFSSNSEQTSPMTPTVVGPNIGSGNLASNVHFEPIHESLVSTMGNGNLHLLHFDKKKAKRNSLPDDASKLAIPASTASADGSSRLLVSGANDNKVVRRKSVSNGSIMDPVDLDANSDHDDNLSTVTNESGSNQELDQILDSATIAPASKKKNREFHHAFRKIPHSEWLIDDFSCALSKDILVQGKMYLSKHYICFNSNILGWVTNITIPLREVIQIEKKSTAVVFPNGMVIRTLHQRYVFATFLSRDSTFNIITKVWQEALLEKVNDDTSRKARTRKAGRGRSNTLDHDLTSAGNSDFSDHDVTLDPVDFSSPASINEKLDGPSRRLSFKAKSKKNDNLGEESSDDLELLVSATESTTKDASPSSGDKDGESFNGFKNPGPKSHAPTKSNYTKDSNDVEITEATFNAPVGVIYDLLFGDDNSTYIKILEGLKNFDIQQSKIVGISNSNKQREYSYTKRLGGSIGPKQTKCLITDTVKFCDFSKYVEIEQVTATPDVPSGNSFKVKTRIFLTWGPSNKTIMNVVSNIEWSAKSWIKGAIEKGSIDGQKDSMKALVDTLNDTLSSKGNGSTPKKRKKAKSVSTPPPAPAAAEEPTKQLTLIEQIEKLIETIGESSPVQIPMVSASITGILILAFASLLYTFCIVKMIGGRGRGVNLLVTGQDSFTKIIRLNDKSYYVFPTSETYLGNEMNRKVNEGVMWKWINDRSGGKLKGEQPMDYGATPYNEFAGQEFDEVVKLAKQRIDQLYRQLDS